MTTIAPEGAHPRPSLMPLLVLGQGRELATERGVECPGDLPAPSDPGLVARARKAKAALGDTVFVLGHHYQRDEVIEFADVTGDSFKLAQQAAADAVERIARAAIPRVAAVLADDGRHQIAGFVPTSSARSSCSVHASTLRRVSSASTTSSPARASA